MIGQAMKRNSELRNDDPPGVGRVASAAPGARMRSSWLSSLHTAFEVACAREIGPAPIAVRKAFGIPG